EVVGGNIGARPNLPIAGYRAVDNLVVHRGQGVVAQAQAVHHAGPELFGNDVRCLDQATQFIDGAFFLEVDGNAAFAAVEQREVYAGVAELGHITAHLIPPAGTLDLDDLGPGLGQDQ